MTRQLKFARLILFFAVLLIGLSAVRHIPTVQARLEKSVLTLQDNPPPPFVTTHVGFDRLGNPLPDDPAGRWIDIDLSAQLLRAYEGTSLVRTFIVSTGRRHTPTITGQFRIYEKLPITTMTGPEWRVERVPHAMYFYQGYSIHGVYWHNDFGVPASYGCVGLTLQDAEWLYNWASIATLVDVHY